ncbi:MAG: hypothetical protein PHZ02_01485 [Desulfocapsaceae bacterium]|nr:hypothetical protein [Desulfocapsaceae bacterium]
MKLVCSICGEETEESDIEVNAIFEEIRCKICLATYGPVPLETLKATIISEYGLKIKDMPKETWHELIMLQIKKEALKSETQEKISKLKSSLLNIGRENKIEKINDEASKARNDINHQIEVILILTKHGLRPKEISITIQTQIKSILARKLALRLDTKNLIEDAKKTTQGIELKDKIHDIILGADKERKKIEQDIEYIFTSGAK